jgi:hypothetical protein
MADLNVTGRDDETIPDTMARARANALSHPPVHPVDSDHLLPESTSAPAPGVIAQVDDPELARLQIEQTRARMSDTIDQIEGALLRKKEDLQERMDVMAPVRRKARENPYPIIGGVFLAGLVLGLLTGGNDDEEEDAPTPAVRRFAADFDRERAHGYYWEERANTWERRARRLMDLANRQEAELLEVRGATVPVPKRRGRLFGRKRARLQEEERTWGAMGYVDTDTELSVDTGVESRGYPRSYADRYDGMPLHDADSYPPRGEEGGYGRDPLPAPI